MKKTASFSSRIPIALMVLAALLPLPCPVRSAPQKEKLTVEKIFGSDELSGKTLTQVQWTPDGEWFTYLDEDENNLVIMRCRAKDGACEKWITSDKVELLGPSAHEKRFRLPSYTLSPEGNHILFVHKNDLYLYDIKTGQSRQLTHDEKNERDPTFSPDGRKVAYIKNHNLYVLDLDTGQERPLTTEGSAFVLIGQFDWVYEEEFEIRTGFFWSPDSKLIAYYRLDQGRVPAFPLVDFTAPHNKVEWLRYPKPGDPNSDVRIGVVSIENTLGVPPTTWMDLGKVADQLYPRVRWLPNSRSLAILRMNRPQNQITLLIDDVATGESQLVLTEVERNGWIDLPDDFIFLEKTSRMLWPSERDGWRHIYLTDLKGNILTPLTQGDWEVTQIKGVDESSGWVYFEGTRASSLERRPYRVQLNGKKLEELNSEPGTHEISLSPNGKYYLDKYSSVTTPPRWTLFKSNGKAIRVIEANPIEARSKYTFTTPEFITVKGADGSDMNAFIHKPPDFNPEKRYPVIFYTYGGPGSQIVVNRWTGARVYYWHQILANEGYVIVGVDNRGTGGRGKAWKHKVYRQLGMLEPQDLVAAAKYFQSLPWVDPQRIGIWGWSYGGYNTLMSLLLGEGVFRAGVAVAPVTDWRNYDTIYTERYMNFPQVNPQGYDQSSAVKLANKLKAHLLIIHGTADDNVHITNTFQLIQELQKQRIPFELMVYPGKDHAIMGKDTRIHLFNTILDFFHRNL